MVIYSGFTHSLKIVMFHNCLKLLETLNPTESLDPWIHRLTMAHWGDMFPGCHRWLVPRYCITLRQPDQFPIEPPSRCPLSILVPKNHLLGFTSSDLNGEESIDYLHMFFCSGCPIAMYLNHWGLAVTHHRQASNLCKDQCYKQPRWDQLLVEWSWVKSIIIMDNH